MGFVQSPSTLELYSQPEEMKQYHAFMYSIPFLLCIILCMSLCLYVCYLKKKASALPSPPVPLPPTLTETPSSVIISVIDKLPTIPFDEELKARDSVCCVCLGEFEMKEELIQIPSCKHIFHSDCIRNWLISTTTCPLCRRSVMVVDNTKLVRPPPQTSPAAVLLPAVTSVQLAATS